MKTEQLKRMGYKKFHEILTIDKKQKRWLGGVIKAEVDAMVVQGKKKMTKRHEEESNGLINV